jgi:hypothetical protein
MGADGAAQGSKSGEALGHLFLRNHKDAIAVMDFFAVPTASLRSRFASRPRHTGFSKNPGAAFTGSTWAIWRLTIALASSTEIYGAARKSPR